MTPVIRIPNDVFERLQALAIPLVDTPGSVIERLLDMHEPKGRPNAVPSPLEPSGGDNSQSVADVETAYETYENRNNPHVTIHRVGCSQLRKRGGVHRHGQGAYKAHVTLVEAGTHARNRSGEGSPRESGPGVSLVGEPGGVSRVAGHEPLKGGRGNSRSHRQT